MPKKQMENEPLHPQLREFGVHHEDGSQSLVHVWCDGRNYDPDTEAYKPQYAYSIVAPNWRYDGNDILGAANELPNLYKASQTLFAYLYAAQESYARHLRGVFTDGNHLMFPEHVNEWAAQNDEFIGACSIACENMNN